MHLRRLDEALLVEYEILSRIHQHPQGNQNQNFTKTLNKMATTSSKYLFCVSFVFVSFGKLSKILNSTTVGKKIFQKERSSPFASGTPDVERDIQIFTISYESQID